MPRTEPSLDSMSMAPLVKSSKRQGQWRRRIHSGFRPSIRMMKQIFLYYGYRYCNASTGKWLSRDPLEEGGALNLYVFNENDSIDSLDELGRQKRPASNQASIPPAPPTSSPTPWPTTSPPPAYAIRTEDSSSCGCFCVGFFVPLKSFCTSRFHVNVVVYDASNKPVIAGIPIHESIVIVGSYHANTGIPPMGTASTPNFTDTHQRTFSDGDGWITIDQTISIAQYKAVFSQTLYANPARGQSRQYYLIARSIPINLKPRYITNVFR